jgi:hypothetical protein
MIFSIRNTLIVAAAALSIGFASGWKVHAWKVAHAENEARKDAQETANRTDVEESERFARSEEVSSDIRSAILASDLNRPVSPALDCMWRAIRERRAAACRLQDPVPESAASVPTP